MSAGIRPSAGPGRDAGPGIAAPHGPGAAMLPGGRLHLSWGPIDLVIGAEGPGREAALGVARAAFGPVLPRLMEEIDALRSPAGPPLHGPVARRMRAACLPHEGFVTPMAAVAGAVADHVLAAMLGAAPGLRRAWVNDGGDVAVHLAPGEAMTMALCDDPRLGTVPGRLRLDRPCGVATSGWRGRSHSLGIADAATVLARTAAEADVAATLIANAVDLPGHPAVSRRPARALSPDSDLGDRPATVAVGRLSPREADRALAAGLARAERMRAAGLIEGAVLLLACRAVWTEGFGDPAAGAARDGPGAGHRRIPGAVA